MCLIFSAKLRTSEPQIDFKAFSKVKVDKFIIWDESKCNLFEDALANESLVSGLEDAYETIDSDEDLALD